MKRKITFYTELAYFVGLILLAAGTALMERADLGISMVVAPAYLIHLKLVTVLPFYSFGMSEYVFQAFLIAALALILKKFKRGFIFSFATAVIYGFMLDGLMSLAALIPAEGLLVRVPIYAAGVVICAAGVAMLFKTYIPPEAYELFVKEIAAKTGRDVSLVKTVYDIASCAVGVALSFAFFGFGVFKGVKWGTLICALVNGPIIGAFSKLYDRAFGFSDALPGLKAFFEK